MIDTSEKVHKNAANLTYVFSTAARANSVLLIIIPQLHAFQASINL